MKNNSKSKKLRIRTLAGTILTLATLAVMVFAAPLPGGDAYAAAGNTYPAHVAHSVPVGTEGNVKKYCFIAHNNAVLSTKDIEDIKTKAAENVEKAGTEGKTPEEIEALKRAEQQDLLEELIFERATVYLKEPNCNDTSHNAITREAWRLITKGDFLMYADQLDEILDATVTDDAPKAFYRDMYVTNRAPESETDVPEPYTYSLASPSLLYVVLATENTAEKYKESVCERVAETTTTTEETTQTATAEIPEVKKPETPAVKDDKEDLPEYKTIRMVSRAGAPLEETLKDGTPVELSWRDSGKGTETDTDTDKSFISRIPGGWITVGIGIAGILALLYFLIIKRKREEPEEE